MNVATLIYSTFDAGVKVGYYITDATDVDQLPEPTSAIVQQYFHDDIDPAIGEWAKWGQIIPVANLPRVRRVR